MNLIQIDQTTKKPIPLTAITNEDYAKFAERTLSLNFYFDSQEKRNELHGAIGLTTEAGELLEAFELPMYKRYVNIVEELGDICWYISIFERKLGVTFKHHFDNQQPHMITHSGSEDHFRIAATKIAPTTTRILDLYKKTGFYGKDVDNTKLQLQCENLNRQCAFLAMSIGITLEEIKLRNINKLLIRYPDKFTNELAENRNVDAEAVALN
jgi:NTP pyrophosphatase (non-canonical NTP hydrolase)